jgi:hypothetical protein
VREADLAELGMGEAERAALLAALAGAGGA